ncbi:MG2 domain-containing protein [Helicobacter sp.]|uniref:alpha-2-macroglobulin family protein n=1 Tax=Helicobacter sp. TaxID=218 RepID=UPI0025C1B6E5|nr:MG2 domain-containing protein [Helicobacter sp.]
MKELSLKFYLYIISAFLIYFMSACSDNGKVSSYTENISTNQDSILITFNTPIVEDTESGAIYEVKASDNIIKLDGKGIDASYAYQSPYELLIAPNYLPLLKPHTKYTLAINLAKLEKTLIEDSLSLPLQTAYTEVNFSSFTPSYIDDKSLRFSIQIAFSQGINISDLFAMQAQDKKDTSKAITLKDDKGADVGFSLESGLDTSLVLLSDVLPIQEDKTYILTLKASYFGLQKDEEIRYVQSAGNLEVTQINAISAETPYIQVHFSMNLAPNPHLENFISISPDIEAKFSQSGNIVRIDAPFNLSQNYQVRIKEGLMGIDKSRMQTPKEDSVIFHQIPPALAFSQQGIFLPSDAQHKIAFKSINLKNVKLKVSKIYPNNITAYLYKQNLIGQTQYKDKPYDYDYYDDDYENRNRGIYADFERLGDVVIAQDFALEMKQNEWIQSEIDLSPLKDKKGIFIIELGFDENDIVYEFPEDTSAWRKEQFFNQAKIQKHLIFSNIALIAQQIGNNELSVMALDMTNNKPLSSVKIDAINSKNQTIESINTDSEGVGILHNASSIMYLDASKDNDHTILRLNAPLSVEGYDVAGEQIQGNTRAYIYTDRGVYRPGESAHINIIARADSKPITHPILVSITSPQGKSVVENISLKEQSFGLFSYTFHTEKNAPSGIYNLQVKIGGSTFWHNIPVENVVPNRIKVEIESPEHLNAQELANNDDSLSFKLSSTYLFGAPASNLNFKADLQIKEVNFYAPSYSDYTFTSPLSLQYRVNDSQEGKLNEQGVAHLHFDTNDVESLGKNLRAILRTWVIESGGRSVQNAKAMDIVLYDSFVGIKAPQTRYVSADSDIHLPIIVLSNDTHKPIANRKLTYRIYHSSYSWWWDYSNYDEFVRSIKSSKYTKILKEGTLTSKLEPVTLSFKPNQSGELFIEVEDEQNHTKSAISLYASEYGEPTLAPKLTQLKIQADKTHYLSSEKAQISFESTKDSKALVSVIGENKVLERFWVDTKETQTQFTLPLKASYAPNVYVSVHLLQNYHTLDNDRSQRLYGVIPLMVEDKDSQLTLEINAPKSIRPNTEFTINLSNKEHKKVAYTLAIVDEGLLDLTNFVSPNPWKFFYQKLALSLSSFDNYDMIIGRNIGKIAQILKVGGDEMLANSQRKDLNQAQRFKPVTFYESTMSDEQGEAKFTYTMPSYMGSVRIMAVAVNEKSYGGASQDMQVSAPVVMLPTIPRSLKIGDTFSLAIEVLPTQEKVGRATLKLKSGDKITLSQNNITLQFDDKKPQSVYIDAKVSEDRIGQDFIDISLSSKGFSMQEKTEIDVLPYNPYTTMSKKMMLEPKSQLTLENPKDFIQGSENGYVIVSKSPIMSIDGRIKWLIRYPYGCIEQTTSSVMPQLFITKLSKANFIDKPTIVRNINAGIARIGGFQTNDGGFAYWQGQPSADRWGSAYAGHFLLLAKAQGYYVPESMLKKWLNYQKHYVKQDANLPTIVYSLYLLSLAGEPQIGLLNDIYEHRFNALAVSDKWILGAAYKLAGLSSMAENITKNLPTKSSRDRDSYSQSYGSSLRDDAMILQAYKDIYGLPHKELFFEIVQKLESSEWYSTQTLGYSLLALAQTAPANTNESGNALNVSFNDKKLESEENADFIKIPFSAPKGKISSNNAFPLYVNQVWDGILLEKDIQPKAQKIALSRSFVDENNNPIDVSSLPSSSTFYLKLTLSNASERVSVDNVAITQNLPSGWEIENTRLNESELPAFISQKGISYTDIKDDKIMWFMDYQGNDISMFVKINAITPGSYLLPPATAEAMYDHSFLANTQSLPIVVTSREKE